MDKEREAELRRRGWVQVGDDLVSPELIALIRARAASPSGDSISWDEMAAQVEREEKEDPPANG